MFTCNPSEVTIILLLNLFNFSGCPDFESFGKQGHAKAEVSKAEPEKAVKAELLTFIYFAEIFIFIFRN